MSGEAPVGHVPESGASVTAGPLVLADFLAALDAALAEPPEPGRESLRVEFDPGRRDAAAGEILIGLGRWFAGAEPVRHAGICLNNKGAAGFPGATGDYGSVTELALDPPAAIAGQWRAAAGDCRDPAAVLARFTLVVEDVSPDSCFGFLTWLARHCGLDRAAFRQAPLAAWVDAVRRWEATGMADDPFKAWPALVSALGHSFLPAAGAATALQSGVPGLVTAWREALRLAARLLAAGVRPDAVPSLWDSPAYARAAAALEEERQDYELSRSQAVTLQLLVPLAGTGDARQRLVDGYFATEAAPSGAKKIFIRTDRAHSHLQQGFALMGLFRPASTGLPAEVTVSVNPGTGIHLKRLWLELERLENAGWDGERPRDNPRAIASYPNGTGYTEPWWDDHGRYTLLGSPRPLPDGRPGSRLAYADVLEAVWRCYNPLGGLSVRDALADDRDTPLPGCTRRIHCFAPGSGVSEKRLAAVRWQGDGARSPSHFQCPTARRLFAAVVARERQGPEIALAELPPESGLEYLALDGGFAVIHDRGALLFDDWQETPLVIEALAEEFQRAAELLGEVLRVNAELQGMATGPEARRSRSGRRLLVRVTELRVALVEARQRSAPVSLRADVRRFRAALEQRWQLAHALEDGYQRAARIEESQRSLAALQTRDLMAALSTFALPFAVSGAIIGHLGSWLESPVWGHWLDSPAWRESLAGLSPGLEAWIFSACSAADAEIWKSCGCLGALKIVLQIGLAAAFIILILLIQRGWAWYSARADRD